MLLWIFLCLLAENSLAQTRPNTPKPKPSSEIVIWPEFQIPVFPLFNGAQPQSPQPRPFGPVPPAPKRERQPWEDEGYGKFKTYHGVDTHLIKRCHPGDVTKSSPTDRDDVPCQCLGMVSLVQEQMQEQCVAAYLRDNDRKKKNNCLAQIPSCSVISDSSRYAHLWDERYKNRCQTYCKDKNCRCCDQAKIVHVLKYKQQLALHVQRLSEAAAWLNPTCSVLAVGFAYSGMDLLHGQFHNMFR